VGTEETHRRQKELFANTGVKVVFHPAGQLQFSRSRYNKDSISVTDSGLKDLFLLGGPSAGDVERDLAEANQRREELMNVSVLP
jgi:hypothetical protein